MQKKPETPDVKSNVVNVNRKIISLDDQIQLGSLKLKKIKKLINDNEEEKTCTDSQWYDRTRSMMSSAGLDKQTEESFANDSLLIWSMGSIFLS